MLHSLNYSKNDPKYTLLSKIFNIDDNNTKDIFSRNGVKNRSMRVLSIKMVFTVMYFDYKLSKLIDELNENYCLRKFMGISGEVPTEIEVYEYLSRYSPVQYSNIVNSILKRLNKPKRRIRNRYIVDATPVACDINTVKRFVTKEHLEKLNLKWGFSTTKGNYIGFKVTMVLDEATLCPVFNFNPLWST